MKYSGSRGGRPWISALRAGDLGPRAAPKAWHAGRRGRGRLHGCGPAVSGVGDAQGPREEGGFGLKEHSLGGGRGEAPITGGAVRPGFAPRGTVMPAVTETLSHSRAPRPRVGPGTWLLQLAP